MYATPIIFDSGAKFQFYRLLVIWTKVNGKQGVSYLIRMVE